MEHPEDFDPVEVDELYDAVLFPTPKLTEVITTLKAPFPYFGGKSAVAKLVWDRLGDTPNYVEPFAGSLAVLLDRPKNHRWWERTETVNDLDGMIANFWRAVQTAPDEVARWADWPINENDLHARHAWLVGQRPSLQARLEGDPTYYDTQIAGWWLWGICSWIGSGWCSCAGPWQVIDRELRKLPHLGNAGRGINRKLPHLGDAGRGLCAEWSEHLQETMQALAGRLRRVRVCCGDWSRVLGPSPTTKLGITGVFLDPPYNHNEREGNLYAVEMPCADAVREWAIEHGRDKLMRIALAGYDTEHAMPADWVAVPWKARGGFGSQGDAEGRGRVNASREVIWFSPHCLSGSKQETFFNLMESQTGGASERG